MTIAFRAGISSITGASANFPVDISGMGLAQNDLVLVLSGYYGGVGAGAGITSTGWHSEFNGKTATSGTTKCWYDASWKIMGSTPDTSVTIKGSTDANTPVIVLVQAWSGVDTTTPMDVAPVYAGTNGAANPGAITPVTAGAVVVAAGIAAENFNVPGAPTGYTNLTANKFLISNAIEAGMASKVWSGSGAEDPATFSGFSTSTTFAAGAFTFALRVSPTFVVVNEANLAISEVGNAHSVYALTVLPSNVKNGIAYSSDGVNWNTGTYAGSGGSGVPIGTVLLDIKTGKLFKILSNSSGMTL